MNKEIGSSFYKLQEQDEELLKLKKLDLDGSYSYFYSGRNAILALLKHISVKVTIKNIWLPEYYCDTVINLIERNFEQVRYYNVNPFEFEIDCNVNKFASKDDVVILNNFWGLSTFSYSFSQNTKPIIIEDHSHGWLSSQSLNSNADYCVSSLRKTYPIPLGAVVWSSSKIDFQLNYEEIEDNSIIEAYEKLKKSMSLKRDFIKSNTSSVKKEYLTLLNEGENLLNLSNNFIKPNADFIKVLTEYSNLNPNIVKQENFNNVKETLGKTKHFKVIERKGFTPFGLLLLFKDIAVFKSFKEYLISQQIYPAHLWPNAKLNSNWKYLLNIHIDFRYNKEDMSYLVEKINIWIKNNV